MYANIPGQCLAKDQNILLDDSATLLITIDSLSAFKCIQVDANMIKDATL